MALLQRAIDLLSEHFDAVQIFATRHEEGEKGGTMHLILGVGNWYARYGHIREWIMTVDAINKDKAVENDRKDRE